MGALFEIATDVKPSASDDARGEEMPKAIESDAVGASATRANVDTGRPLLQCKPPLGGKRKRSHAKGGIGGDLSEWQLSSRGLRIPASSVAAVCGLHPFQNLPQLLFDCVYQSHTGRSLLERDAGALGLTLVDARAHEREAMLHLASAASEEARELVQRALEVSEGTRTLRSVDEVQSMQTSIRAQAVRAREAGKLSEKQAESLVEASRGHVSTGFGTCHEDEALDVYEKLTGCSVRERNEALMEWRFARVEDIDGEMGVTAVPMGVARRRLWEQPKLEGDGDKGEEPVKATENYGTKSEPIDLVDDSSVDGDNAENRIDGGGAAASSSSSAPLQDKPFFRIVGAVDGIRDELYMDSSKPTPASSASIAPADSADTLKNDMSKINNLHQNAHSEFSDDEEDQWSLRPIIVECKHRMREAKVPPPLYDQIQTCLYCHMYNVEEADLIQVVRRRRKFNGKKSEESKSNEADGNGNSNGKLKRPARKEEDIEITTTRVSLNDPIHNHSHHWRATLLPRIASFVDAVYSVRKDDGKRYRLLMAMVRSQEEESANGAEEELWRVLWDECPWMRHCDTSFGKRRII